MRRQREDGMIVSCVCEEEVTMRDIHEELTTRGKYDSGSVEESDDKDLNMSMDVPLEDYDQELAEACVDIDGQELDPETARKARALENAWNRKVNVNVKRPVEECFDQSKKPSKKPSR